METPKDDIQLPKMTGFETPNGYLDSLEAAILAKVEADQEGFETPAGYMDALEGKILAQTTLEPVHSDAPRGKIISLRKALAWASAAAAVALCVWQFYPQNPECETFACLLEQTEFAEGDLEYLQEEDNNKALFDVEPEDYTSLEVFSTPAGYQSLEEDEMIDFLVDEIDYIDEY